MKKMKYTKRLSLHNLHCFIPLLVTFILLLLISPSSKTWPFSRFLSEPAMAAHRTLHSLYHSWHRRHHHSPACLVPCRIWLETLPDAHNMLEELQHCNSVSFIHMSIGILISLGFILCIAEVYKYKKCSLYWTRNKRARWNNVHLPTETERVHLAYV